MGVEWAEGNRQSPDTTYEPPARYKLLVQPDVAVGSSIEAITDQNTLATPKAVGALTTSQVVGHMVRIGRTTAPKPLRRSLQ